MLRGTIGEDGKGYAEANVRYTDEGNKSSFRSQCGEAMLEEKAMTTTVAC